MPEVQSETGGVPQPPVADALERESFITANKWQRQCLELGSEGYNSFIVIVSLFLVLLVENLWSFDPSFFSSAEMGDAVLALLIFGAGFGLFTMLSATAIKMKVQRLLARDIRAYQAFVSTDKEEQKISQLNRLMDKWKESTDHKGQAACLTSEWYRGGRKDIQGKKDPRRPRSLVTYAMHSFIWMILSSVIALAVMLADAKGAAWAATSAVVVGCGLVLPAVFISYSLRKPPGVENDEKNPFQGFG